MAERGKRRSNSSPESSAALDARGLLRATPVLLRLAFAAWLRTTGRAAEVSVRVSTRVVRGAASGAGPAELIHEVGDELRGYLKLLLGVDDEGADPDAGGSSSGQDKDAARGTSDGTTSPATVEALREQGEELLDRSASVDVDVDAHPAYEHILQELFPDEGRILRFLAERGPQPAVDVRVSGALGVGKSRLVAPGLNMIAIESGCLHPEHGHQYLNNLHRLGLLWFSREELDDINVYQVLEAQPEVGDAMDTAGRGAQTVRRSIHLTPFGADFCKTCLPITNDEIDTLPREVD